MKAFLSPKALPKKHVTTVSRILIQKMQTTKENRSQNQTLVTGQEFIEFRKETNIKIAKLERILEEINGKFQK